jgi:hypothetical protein
MEAAKNKKTKLYFPLKSQICFFYESDFYLNLRIEPAPPPTPTPETATARAYLAP